MSLHQTEVGDFHPADQGIVRIYIQEVILAGKPKFIIQAPCAEAVAAAGDERDVLRDFRGKPFAVQYVVGPITGDVEFVPPECLAVTADQSHRAAGTGGYLRADGYVRVGMCVVDSHPPGVCGGDVHAEAFVLEDCGGGKCSTGLEEFPIR